MTQIAAWLTLVPAALTLALTPGPSNLLSVHVAAADGLGAACRAGLGRLVAFALILLLAALGLAALLQVAPRAVPVLQTAAALYLLHLAVRLARAAPPAAGAVAGGAGRGREALRREFCVALGNPKFLVIATAFVPQCIDPGRPAGPQLAAVSLLVLLLEVGAIAVYAGAGRGLQGWLSTPARWRVFGRLSAAAMAAAALWLTVRLWA